MSPHHHEDEDDCIDVDDVDSTAVEEVAVVLRDEDIRAVAGVDPAAEASIEISVLQLGAPPEVRVLVQLTREQLRQAVGARRVESGTDGRVTLAVSRDQLRRAADAPANSKIYLEPGRPEDSFRGRVIVKWRRWRERC